MRHDSRPPRPPGRLKRFAANAMLFFYGTQLLSGCVPAGSPSDETGGGGEVARARAALDTVPFELRSDTILPTTSATPEAPGITPFTADVTPGGSASVSIPLWVPPGRAGIQPSLSIVYDSQGSDGLLGPGFNLAGLSQITLCPNSFARDGKLHAVDLFPLASALPKNDYTKAYCLDGVRLASTGLREFKTEQDTYVSIRIPEGDNTTNPATFEVRGRDGLIRTYGRTAATGGTREDALIRGQHAQHERAPDNSIWTVNNNPVTLAWALASVEDRFGNRMDVFYEQAAVGAASGAWHRPSRIAYTQFRDASGTIEPGKREVLFGYESRTDVFTGYLSGVKLGRDFRLSRIDMRGPGLAPGASTLSTVPLRSYQLKYYPGAISRRSLLTELRECDGQDVCKAPVRFDWEQGSWDFDYPAAINVSDAAAGAGLNAFGLGAGRQGLAYFVRSEKTHEVELDFHSTNGQVTEFTEQNWRDVMRLLEYTDSAATILTSSEVTGLSLWHPWFNIQGTGWLEDIWDSIFGSDNPGDFCGKRNERGLYPMVTDWNGFGRSNVTPLSCFWKPSGQLQIPAPVYGHVNRGSAQVKTVGSEPNSQFWLDVDGDGRNERVWMGQHEIDLTGDADTIVPNKRSVVVEPATGRTTQKSPVGYFQRSRFGVRAVDLDGSGKMSLLGVGPGSDTFLDALSYREVMQGNANSAELKALPTSLRKPPNWSFLFPDLYAFTYDFIDVNGDGLQDAVALGQLSPSDTAIKLRVQLNTGKGFTEVRETVMPNTFLTMLFGAKTEHGDFDGDGRVDLAIFRQGEPVKLLLAGPQGEFTRVENLSIVPSGDNKEWSQVIDTNNDGLLDFTWRVGNELRTARRQKPVDVLTKVHGNVQKATYQGYSGLSYSFEYAPLSRSNPHGAVTPSEPFYTKSYTETADKPWLRTAPESMRVVSRLSLNSNEQRVQSWRYLYRDGLSDTRGLGWLGFGQHIVIDEVTGTRTTTTYDNQFIEDRTDRKARAPLAHLPKSETVEIPLNLSTTLQTQRQWYYTRAAVTGTDSYRVYASRVAETVRELRNGSATVVSESETLTTLDDYGTPLAQTVLTHGANTTEQVQTFTTPSFNTSTWLPQGTWPITTSWASCSKAPIVGCLNPSTPHVRTQQVTYDARGQVESAETEPSRLGEAVTPTTSETYLKTLFARNARGLVEQISQQGSGVTRTESVTYDGVDQTQVATTTDAGGAVWRYLFHPGLGVLAQTADPNGVHMRFQYDGFGRQRIVTPLYQGPSVTPGDQSIVQTFYEWNGTLPQHRTRVATGLSSVDESITHFDTLGRPVTTQGKRHDGQTVVSSIGYDSLGRVVRQGAPRTESEKYTWETYEYDALGRVTARRFVDGTNGVEGSLIESFGYTVPAPYTAQATATDALGQVKKTLVDFRGLMTQSTEAVGTAKEATMTYTYGPFGRVEHADDPMGHRMSSFYDTFGRLERTVDPNSGTRTFLYNAFGELKSQSDAPVGTAGRLTTTHQRDLLGRVLTSTNEKQTLSYEYDLGPGGMRRLSRATRTPVGNPDGVVITDHVHDAFGRETDTAQRVGAQGDTLVLSRQYDAYGRVSRLTYPVTLNGTPVSIGYGYSDKGDVSTIFSHHAFTNYWRAYEKDSQGRLKTVHYGSGVARIYRYDSQGRLRFTEATRSANNVQRLAYEYTANDNLAARHDLVLGVTQKYTYDALDRLERWKVQQNCQTLDVQFQYDKLGNMLSRAPVVGSEPSASLQYTGGTSGGPHAVKQAQLGAESFTYEYDHRGNQTAMRNAQGALVREVQYTPFDLPESLTTSGGTAHFDYDASGTRVRKRSIDGQEVLYVGGLYQRRKQGLTTTHVLSVPSPEGVVAELTWNEGDTSESVRYFLNDPQGSPDTVTSATGAVLERIKYEPFGGRRDPSNLAQVSSTSHSGAHRGYTGHEQDDELGLINMRGRIYDPRLMRFLSVDPVIAEPGSTQAHNAYSYVLNNPTRYTDPSGFTPYGGSLVSSWGNGWTGAPQSHQSLMMSALERHLNAPGPSLFLPNIDTRLPSVQTLDDAKAQPDAHHTNDIGQSSGSSKSALTSLLTTASTNLDAGLAQNPCGPHLGCRMAMGMVRGQLDSMLNASVAYDRYAPVSKLAAVSFAINEFIPFVSAGESAIAAKAACTTSGALDCGLGVGRFAYHTLAAGTALYSTATGAAGAARSGVNTVRSGFARRFSGEVRNRIGHAIAPMEKTLEMALSPEAFAEAVVKRYRINLRGSGKTITLKFNPNLPPGNPGKIRKANPTVIEFGPEAIQSEANLANTIAHELNHARSWLRGGDAPESTAYAAGDALEEFIKGLR